MTNGWIGDAMRSSKERHSGATPAVRDGHRYAVLRPDVRGGATRARFTSMRPDPQPVNRFPRLLTSEMP
ncbi:hypothetical protein ABZ153_23190 [Streptomyces sp. NPDC006290]|uniref:hypothetical protein n=1 Tax=Streptomyces sp. NPDC006290 TaxID=3156745 RepID=UPI0033A8E49F